MELRPSDWLALIKHVKQWLSNLGRAGKLRKQESKKALRSVLMAVRETESYVTDLNGGGKQSRKREKDISLLWTSLSFDLEDIGLTKLARVCQIKGKYWATRKKDGTSFYSDDFLNKAGTRLADIERTASLSLKRLT